MIYYTNAPKDYDYRFVTELDPDVGRLTSGIDTDRPVRKIDLSGASEWQVQMMQDRYLSGLYPMIPEHQWQEWLDAGFATGGDKNSEGGDADDTPSPGQASCAHCNAASRLADVGTTCRSCGRGVITILGGDAAEADDGEEDESDYSRGMDPDSWCADDAAKGE